MVNCCLCNKILLKGSWVYIGLLINQNLHEILYNQPWCRGCYIATSWDIEPEVEFERVKQMVG